jgi:hypothetical protein
MSFRPAPILLLAFAVACGRADGPQRRQDDAFVFATTVPAGMPVHVKNLRGRIEVTPSPDDSLRVTAALLWRGDAERPRGIKFLGASFPTAVLVCSIFGDGECTVDDYSAKQRRSFGLGGADDVKVEFTVQVPAGVRLELIGVDTRIASASSGPVRAKTINGDVLVATAVGPVDASTMNGNVDARMTSLAGPDSVIAKTMNGDAWAFIPESAAVSVDVGTTNGRVQTDFAELQAAGKSITGGIRGGGTPVYVRTLNGDAGLGRLDAQGKSSLRP